MYRKENSAQMPLDGFYVPFAERLSPDNRWVKLGKKMPWDIIEEEYLKMDYISIQSEDSVEVFEDERPSRVGLSALLSAIGIKK